jgi:hypothetical protein
MFEPFGEAVLMVRLRGREARRGKSRSVGLAPVPPRTAGPATRRPLVQAEKREIGIERDESGGRLTELAVRGVLPKTHLHPQATFL